MCNCKQNEFELQPELENLLLNYGNKFFEEEVGQVCTGLTADQQENAKKLNRFFAKQIGWGCIKNGKVQAAPKIFTALGVTETSTEEEIVCAIANWQKSKIPVTGKLDLSTWNKMFRVKALTQNTFKPLVLPVYFMGKQLGVIEKTMPYKRCFYGPPICTPAGVCRQNRICQPNRIDSGANKSVGGGAQIELGFRITDMEAVRKAGFIDGSKMPQFNWIQTFDFITILAEHLSPEERAKFKRLPGGAFVRRYKRVIDPTRYIECDWDDKCQLLDNSPYYYDMVTYIDPIEPGKNADPSYHISNHINRPSENNHMCYDLLFEDAPRMPLSLATAQHRTYMNFETALVGIRPGKPVQNVILNTVLWGYDIVYEAGKPDVRLNHLGPGVKGGSPAFKKILSGQIKEFPDHCFAGEGFASTARCR